MSTTSPIKRLRARIEQEVRQELPAALLDAGVQRHTGKGLRDCDCDFCLHKRYVTGKIGHVPMKVTYRSLTYYDRDPWFVRDINIRNWREAERQKARRELDLLKQQIISTTKGTIMNEFTQNIEGAVQAVETEAEHVKDQVEDKVQEANKEASEKLEHLVKGD